MATGSPVHVAQSSEGELRLARGRQELQRVVGTQAVGRSSEQKPD